MPEDTNTSYKDRLLASGLLRENAFFEQPGKYSLSDIAEDLPGPLRIPGMILKDVIPSLSILSKNPEERKQQLARAAARIRSSKESHEGLSTEIAGNIKNTLLKGAPIGLGLAGLFHLAGFRNPILRTAKGIKLQTPTNFSGNFSKLLKDKAYAKKLLKDSLSEASLGVGIGLTHGVATPLFSHGVSSDKAIDEAQKTIEEHPYLTSLPTAQMLSVMKKSKPESSEFSDKVKNVLLGTGLGIAQGAAAGLSPALFKLLGHAGMGAINRLRGKPTSPVFEGMGQELAKDMRTGALFGGGLGALSGAVTNRLPDTENA